MSGITYTRPDSFVSDWWGEPFTEGLVNRIVSAPRERLIDFADGFAELELIEPDLVPGMLRPLAAVDDHAGDRLIDGNQIRGTARIRALSLYAHQVGVWDPLPLQIVLMRGLTRRQDPWSSAPLRSALMSILELKPLADADIIVWLPDFPFAFSDVMETFAPQVDQLLSQVDVAGLPLVEEPLLPDGISRNPHYSPWDDIHFAIVDVATDLSRCQNGMELQPVAGNPLAQRILSYLADSKLPNADPRLPHLATLVELVDHLAVPSVSDIVAVRKASSAFNDWRSALGRTLTIVNDLSVTGSDLQATRDIANEELSGPRQMIDDELAQSTALAVLRRSGSNLGWSVLGAVPGAVMGDARTAGMGVASGTTINWIRTYLQGLKRRAGQRSLLAHYLTFGSHQSAGSKELRSPSWIAHRPQYVSPHNADAPTSEGASIDGDET